MNEDRLSELLTENVKIRRIEADLYSVYSPREIPGSYDSLGASAIYDRVACNRLYNRLMWGYSTKDYPAFCDKALASFSEGWVLDLACGSLAFTAGLYAGGSKRPIVFMDQSLNLLRKGKSRLKNPAGKLPDNMVFLHADALALPFRSSVFRTVISLNLLHCLDQAGKALAELKRVLTADGTAVLTTLVRSTSRWSNGYLNRLARSGLLVARDADQLGSMLSEADLPAEFQIKGSLAFISCRLERAAPAR